MIALNSHLFLVIAALAGCFMSGERTPAEAGQELTPPSELALMMRHMAAHADSVKAALSRGDGLPAYPKEFKGLMQAEPTKGMHIDPITFPTFAKDYQLKLDELYKVQPAKRQQAYNALVQGCANCHGSHCPGPLMRIKKMYMATEE
ncbi:MAG: hypothetical protein KDB95_01240 [Flavobacteriales bacterium]|nr:hypothetical protein [Flavobacteriales bacterium]